MCILCNDYVVVNAVLRVLYIVVVGFMLDVFFVCVLFGCILFVF